MTLAQTAGLEREPEYLVKWVGKAHVHNEWVVEDILMKIAKRKFTNFKRRYEAEPVMLMQPAWLQPCTFLCRRPCQAGPGWEVLVKWCDLGYENATWEVAHPCSPVPDSLHFNQVVSVWASLQTALRCSWHRAQSLRLHTCVIDTASTTVHAGRASFSALAASQLLHALLHRSVPTCALQLPVDSPSSVFRIEAQPQGMHSK